MQNRFELELSTKKNEIMPVFEIEGNLPGINKSEFGVMLRNKGLEARTVSITSHTENIGNISSNRHASAGGKFRVDFSYEPRIIKGQRFFFPPDEWAMLLSFTDSKGVLYSQKLHKTNGVIMIDEPTVNNGKKVPAK